MPTATTKAKQQAKVAQTNGELLSNRKILGSTRKQIDIAYKKICGIEIAIQKRAFGKFNQFFKKEL